MSASECRNYHRPTSLRETLALMAGAGVPVWPVAGGTDLLVRDLRHQMPPGPWEMVSLKRVPELCRIEADGDTVRIGGAVVLVALAALGGGLSAPLLVVSIALVIGALVAVDVYARVNRPKLSASEATGE